MKATNKTILLMNNWLFHKGELPRKPESDHAATYLSNMAGYGLSLYDMFVEGVSWENVNLPHDWMVDEPFDTSSAVAGGFKKRGSGWYYCEFELDEKIEVANLIFEGVLGQCRVYVNGTVAGRNFSGYNKFSFDVEPYLLEGKNTIAVYVDGAHREGWWYEGAGIYRAVYLQLKESLHFCEDDAFFRSEKCEKDFYINTTLAISGLEDSAATVLVTVFDQEGKKVAKNRVYAAAKTEVLQKIKKAHLWSPETPYLYTVKCELFKGRKKYDEITKTVGIREICWTADGMYLNGQPYKIKGICCHQDHSGVGAAVTKEIIDYRVKILKSLGANSYRCAHHAVSEDLLSACDRYGLLVMAENRNFAASDEVLGQLESMVKVSRNHPSVFMYSLFNEERWQSEPNGQKIFRKMHKHLLNFDTTRIVAGAQSAGPLNKESHNTVQVMDIIGVNYNVKDYAEIHKKFPDRCILGTENCPTYATRAVYKNDENYYDNYATEWPKDWSQSIEETMDAVNKYPFVAGCFAWSGFDYRGEPQPKSWPSVSSHWGFTDYCGFYKDTAYLLMAYYKKELTAHLFPHWNWRKGEMVRVCAYTNADTVDLFVNDAFFGTQKVADNRVLWKVPFQEGNIKIVAKRQNETVTDIRYTTGKVAEIELTEVTKEGDTTRIINVSAVDKNGNIVPTFNGEIEFSTEGDAITYVGNGDPINHVSEKSKRIALFGGMAQIIVRGSAKSLSVACKGLKNAKINFK